MTVSCPSMADMMQKTLNVRFWHLADIVVAFGNVRFRGKSGHRNSPVSCLLVTQSGHEALRIAAVQTER
jgi:hypothetical protein